MNTGHYNSRVYLYNVRSNEWAINFKPSTTNTSTVSTNTSTTSTVTYTVSGTSKILSSPAIEIGIGIGVTAVISAATLVFFYKKRRNHQKEQILEISGNSSG